MGLPAPRQIHDRSRLLGAGWLLSARVSRANEGRRRSVGCSSEHERRSMGSASRGSLTSDVLGLARIERARQALLGGEVSAIAYASRANVEDVERLGGVKSDR
jgi:hypothetical protein